MNNQTPNASPETNATRPHVPFEEFVLLWEDIAVDDNGKPKIDDKGNPVLAGNVNYIEDFIALTGLKESSAQSRASQIRGNKDANKKFNLRKLESKNPMNRTSSRDYSGLSSLVAKAAEVRMANAS